MRDDKLAPSGQAESMIFTYISLIRASSAGPTAKGNRGGGQSGDPGP